MKSWTGGTEPKPYNKVSLEEKRIVGILFKTQIEIWKEYWKSYPDFATEQLLFGRARYDAHATLNQS